MPAIAGDAGDSGSIPGSGRLPRGGNGRPLQYSCLENPMDRRAWWATVYGVTKSWTQLSTRTHTHTHTCRQLFEYHDALGTKLFSCIKSLNPYSNPTRLYSYHPILQINKFTQGLKRWSAFRIYPLIHYTPRSPLYSRKEKKNLPLELEEPIRTTGQAELTTACLS